MKTYFLDPDSIRNLFDAIAPRYDLLNHLLSLRRDVYWRRMAVRQLRGIEGWILDIATGTGDVAVEIIHQNGQRNHVAGVDFSEPMLHGAQLKLGRGGLTKKIVLSRGDALSLPFRGNTFRASIMAFGLRNVVKKDQAVEEMVRVVREGGKVIILEFTLPQKGALKGFYSFYFRRVLPWIGGLVSGNRGAYAYLPESVFHFPHAGHYEAIMRSAGLEDVRSYRLTNGIASIMEGTKKRPGEMCPEKCE